MKTKSLIKLACLVVIVAVIAVWALSGFVIGEYKFLNWGSKMPTSGDIDRGVAVVYSSGSLDADETLSRDAAVANNIKIVRARLEQAGYLGCKITKQGVDKIRIEVPSVDSFSVADTLHPIAAEALLSTRGIVSIKDSNENEILTDKQIVSSAFLGYDSTTSSYYLEIVLNGEGKAKLAQNTSSGAMTFNVLVDGTKKGSFNTTETVNEGRINVALTSYGDALLLGNVMNNGALSTSVSLAEGEKLLTAQLGENSIDTLALVAGIVILALMIFAIAYYRLAAGIGAALSIFISCLGLYFFASTFTWFVLDISGAVGLFIGLILIAMVHFASIESMKKEYAAGKAVFSAITDGSIKVRNAFADVLVCCIIASAAMWIFGSETIAWFGMGILGGSVIAFVGGIYVNRSLIKLLINCGLSKSSVLGLK